MLLARYALAIIDSERICARRYMQQLHASIAAPAPALLVERAERLIAFVETRQRTRFDNCLLPALRAAATQVPGSSPAERDALDEIERLAQLGGDMLPGLRACLRFPAAASLPASLPAFLQAYCANLALRLECEEARLVPLACHLLSAEAWFHVGAAFLRQDEDAGASNHGISAKVH